MGDLQTPLITYESLYPPLSIRLIDLHPATETLSDLHCEIIHVNLLDPASLHPPYVALSYAWGSTEKTCSLRCGTSHLPITSSLDAALRSIRKTSWNLLIWADAVCINQENLEERNSQVANMIHIYSRASSVLLWTGEDDIERSGAKCLEWLKFIARQPNFALQSEIRPPEMKLLERFFAREWFMRRWVVQEAAVATHAFVICGLTRITWYDFIEGVAILRVRHDKAAAMSYHETLKKLCMIEILNKRYRVAGVESGILDGPSLLQIMAHFESSHCSDAKDRVFSLMRLATLANGEAEALSPILDYSLTTESVYTMLASVLLKASDHYALLHYAAAFRKESITQSVLPSWVPDWRFRPRVTPLLHPEFNCGLGMPGRINLCVDHLSVQGCIYDHIASSKQLIRTSKKGVFHIGETIKALNDRDSFERFSMIRGNVYHSPAQPLPMSSVSRHHRSSLRDAKLILAEAAEEIKSSSEEHATQAQASWLEIGPEDIGMSTKLVEGLPQSEMMRGRKLFMTRKGIMGIGPSDAEQGDAVAILCGSRTPFVLRQNSEASGWRIVGDAYVTGITTIATTLHHSLVRELRIV
jgi:hypothetical protein